MSRLLFECNTHKPLHILVQLSGIHNMKCIPIYNCLIVIRVTFTYLRNTTKMFNDDLSFIYNLYRSWSWTKPLYTTVPGTQDIFFSTLCQIISAELVEIQKNTIVLVSSLCYKLNFLSDKCFSYRLYLLRCSQKMELKKCKCFQDGVLSETSFDMDF